MAMQTTSSNSDGEPMMEMNTTPLIDVMLVLLIMFIVTIPMNTHKVSIDLPSGAPPSLKTPPVHELAIGATGRLSCDGIAVSEAALPEQLSSMASASPDAVLKLRTDAATRYELFDRVLASVKRSGVERLGFVGNEQFRKAI